MAAAEAYQAQVNAALPSDCGVLQLPYVVYPEQGLMAPELNDYEHFLQGLVNEDKDFSYGAVKNTEASAPLEDLGNRQSPGQVRELVAQGLLRHPPRPPRLHRPGLDVGHHRHAAAVRAAHRDRRRRDLGDVRAALGGLTQPGMRPRYVRRAWYEYLPMA